MIIMIMSVDIIMPIERIKMTLDTIITSTKHDGNRDNNDVH